MLNIAEDMTITMSYMENAKLNVSAKYKDGTKLTFQQGDVVRLKIWPLSQGESISFDAAAEAETEAITITIKDLHTQINESSFTKGEPITNNWRKWQPVECMYSITLNPDTDPAVLVGYDSKGPKIFRVYP